MKNLTYLDRKQPLITHPFNEMETPFIERFPFGIVLYP
jgi:hypothetical protein